MREYKNKESQEIEDFLNKAREELNKEAGFELLKYPVEVIFLADDGDQKCRKERRK